MTYVLLLVGLVILVVGAELLVRGSVTLAAFAGVSPLIIGLTVVAFGTSAPELAVSSVSSLKGDSEIALGNVIGSNICNILLILGISAVIVPLSVSSQLVRLDVPVMIASSVAVWGTAYDGAITRVEGILLFLGFILYTIYMIRKGRREEASRRSAIELEADFEAHPVLSVSQGVLNAVYILVGLGMLVLGAQLLVDSAVKIATEFGISEIVIGLTIVAIGTSLPELATSVVAAMKGQRDLAVGNAVGSNMFNLMIVLPAAAVLSPAGVPVTTSVLWFDLAVMTMIALICWPIFISRSTVSRFEGVVMLGLFAAYTTILIAEATKYGSVQTLKTGYSIVILPAVIVFVSITALLHLRGGRGESAVAQSKT
ncbi:calcium/sodium antiporter [Novipirellula rosea]|uniref:Calcium/sodium antiporter n=1 Tax=Novipirellula rosea TaxID=1031540 RepID=A0ABP8NFM2_9BACT